LRTFFWTFVLLLVLWLLMVGSVNSQEIAAGVAVSLIVSSIVRPSARSLISGEHPLLRRFAYAVAYVPYLLLQIVKANIDVARRVVDPALPIRPGIVHVRTGLKSPLGRLALASSITLTPGTLTVDIDGQDLFIHWIDVEAEGVGETSRKIVGGFERYLEVIFG
jgi:multicomponent Na+:H+ antiporter subunit E